MTTKRTPHWIHDPKCHSSANQLGTLQEQKMPCKTWCSGKIPMVKNKSFHAKKSPYFKGFCHGFPMGFPNFLWVFPMGFPIETRFNHQLTTLSPGTFEGGLRHQSCTQRGFVHPAILSWEKLIYDPICECLKWDRQILMISIGVPGS